jgi:nitroreductase
MIDTSAAWLDWTRELIHGRRNFTARRLTAPGPSREQLDAILDAACSAPDHGELTPWRFVLVPEHRRDRLGEVFREALLERDIEATAKQQSEAAEKALRAPCLLLAVVDLSPKDKPIPAMERYISLGCAIQNMLLMARAMGFDSGLGSGQSLGSAALRSAFALAEHEQASCFVSFGTASKAPHGQLRPGPAQILSEFSPASRSPAR